MSVNGHWSVVNSLPILQTHLNNKSIRIQNDPSELEIAVEIPQRGNSLAIVRTHYNKPRQSITEAAIPSVQPLHNILLNLKLKVCKFLVWAKL